MKIQLVTALVLSALASVAAAEPARVHVRVRIHNPSHANTPHNKEVSSRAAPRPLIPSGSGNGTSDDHDNGPLGPLPATTRNPTLPPPLVPAQANTTKPTSTATNQTIAEPVTKPALVAPPIASKTNAPATSNAVSMNVHMAAAFHVVVAIVAYLSQ